MDVPGKKATTKTLMINAMRQNFLLVDTSRLEPACHMRQIQEPIDPDQGER